MDINKFSCESFEKTIQYQEDFLDFFGLDTYDDTIIREKTEQYYEKMKDIECIPETALSLARNHFLTNDEELGFYVFFSEDYFYEFKKLIEHYEEHDEFDIQSVEEFCRNIKK
jgi:hypothetical protein